MKQKWYRASKAWLNHHLACAQMGEGDHRRYSWEIGSHQANNIFNVSSDGAASK
jgi:hypothetical protein